MTWHTPFQPVARFPGRGSELRYVCSMTRPAVVCHPSWGLLPGEQQQTLLLMLTIRCCSLQVGRCALQGSDDQP